MSKQQHENCIETVDNKPKKRRWLIVLVCFLCFAFNVLGFLQLGVVVTSATWDFWYPDYEKVEIEHLLRKDMRTNEEYALIYAQTGLTKTAIDDMLSEVSAYEVNIDTILTIQDKYFTPVEVESRRFNPFTYLDEIDIMTRILRLRDGDIIVSATTRVSWLRYGHAALVVDGDERKTVESIGPGTDSKFQYAESFCDLANFIVLRPKVDEQTKAQVVKYAQESLVGIPYRFTVGLFYDKYQENIECSQCAHLVWYAYKKFGIDLDANGGWLVKPQDIALSPHVEVVQVYGFNPDTLWSE